jgi:type I restriction enzyme, S subunit
MNTSSWKSSQLSDVCDLIVDCINRTASTVSEVTPYMMIRTNNVKNGWIDLTDTKYVPEDTYIKWTRRAVPKKDDVILTREAPLGEVGIIRDNNKVFLGQRLVMYRTNKEILLPKFLLYSLMSYGMLEQIKSMGSGSTVEHMRVPDSKKLVINYPSIEEQRRIVDLISTLDDLFELNIKLIDSLENTATQFFVEWFINFRYPGYKNDEINKTDNGFSPIGWEWTKLKTLFKFQKGRKVDNLYKKHKEGTYPYLLIKGLQNLDFEYTDSNSVFAHKDDIIMVMDGASSSDVYIGVEGVVGSTLGYFRIKDPKITSPYLIYHLLKSRIEHLKLNNVGSAIPHASKNFIEEIDVLIPTAQINMMFNQLGSDIHTEISLLKEKNKHLRQIRNHLIQVTFRRK